MTATTASPAGATIPAIDDLLRAASDPALRPLAEKVVVGERLSFDDGLVAIESPDLNTLGRLADVVRRRHHGDEVYFYLPDGLGTSKMMAFLGRRLGEMTVRNWNTVTKMFDLTKKA